MFSTGFEKISIFQLLPCLLNDSGKQEHSFGLVVRLLVSILKYQVEELTCFGFRAFAIAWFQTMKV